MLRKRRAEVLTDGVFGSLPGHCAPFCGPASWRRTLAASAGVARRIGTSARAATDWGQAVRHPCWVWGGCARAMDLKTERHATVALPHGPPRRRYLGGHAGWRDGHTVRELQDFRGARTAPPRREWALGPSQRSSRGCDGPAAQTLESHTLVGARTRTTDTATAGVAGSGGRSAGDAGPIMRGEWGHRRMHLQTAVGAV